MIMYDNDYPSQLASTKTKMSNSVKMLKFAFLLSSIVRKLRSDPNGSGKN
jgi:hypothetical protein